MELNSNSELICSRVKLPPKNNRQQQQTSFRIEHDKHIYVWSTNSRTADMNTSSEWKSRIIEESSLIKAQTKAVKLMTQTLMLMHQKLHSNNSKNSLNLMHSHPSRHCAYRTAKTNEESQLNFPSIRIAYAFDAYRLVDGWARNITFQSKNISRIAIMERCIIIQSITKLSGK